MAVTEGTRRIVGGVDTHKDLHVAAVVDEQDRVMETRSFATTRQGYRQMLAWMRSFGELQRIGIESTGSYGAGLLRFMQQAGIAVLEVTTPDKQDRRRRGKNDDLDAQNAAHAAFAGQRTVTPRSRDGMIEIPAGSHGLPEDRGERQAGRPADDPQHDRLRPRRPSGSAPQPHPDATRPNVGLVAARSDRISRPGVPPIVSASSLWPAATSNCMTRSRTWTR